MRDHIGNEVVVGDWVRLRNDKKRIPVQIVKIVHGQIAVKDFSSRSTSEYKYSTSVLRCPRAYIKLEPEELI